MPARKCIRINPALYTGKCWYFLTICTQRRAPVFASAPFAKAITKYLLDAAAAENFLLHAWCVMPDHVHILVEGETMACQVFHFARRFKSESAHSYLRRFGRQLWQRAFFDHILRPHESPEPFEWYIWLNPVRKGLCRNAAEYPWSGSQSVDWRNSVSLCTDGWVPPWRKPRTKTVAEVALDLPAVDCQGHK